MHVILTVVFAYFCVFQFTIARGHDTLLKDIEQLTKLADVDDIDVLNIIKTELESLYPDAIAFNKHKYSENEYQFDESIDCAFNLLDLTNEMTDLAPIIANKLKLKYDETVHTILYKGLESSIYILCESEEKIDTDMRDGFVEWVSMEDKRKRANIEGIIVNKMKKAFKLKLNKKAKKKYEKDTHGDVLYNKCKKKLKTKHVRGLYQALRRKYPKQRNILDMISSIFMYSCARKYATQETVQNFMKILVSVDDADIFFNYLANNMEPYLESSNDNDECLQQTAELIYLLEVFILKRHSEFKKYPVFNAMSGLVELGCAKKFVFEDDTMPDLNDIPNKPDL